MDNDYSLYMDISEEVQQALSQKRPVVALESTIISHGFTYPQNLDCALTCEQKIRDNGAVPATIAIIGGRIKIGLSHDGIKHLAITPNITKCSRRDIAVIISSKMDGATTVATTMIFADMAGIKIFATGGIGGVHREAQQTFDISADLEEFARTPMTVVCAGAKSILDIGLTLEYLETAGVSVLGYKTDQFPAFYTRTSGFGVDYKMDSAQQIADLLQVKEDLELKSGVLVANPIPEADQLDQAYIDQAIGQALADAKAQNIRGKATTPFLLEALDKITAGKSVAANKALVFNNASVAAQIAVEMSKLAK